MQKAVRAGEIITKYLASFLCANIPKNGFSKDGIFLDISKKALIESDKPIFSINSGKIGAKNEE